MLPYVSIYFGWASFNYLMHLVLTSWRQSLLCLNNKVKLRREVIIVTYMDHMSFRLYIFVWLGAFVHSTDLAWRMRCLESSIPGSMPSLIVVVDSSSGPQWMIIVSILLWIIHVWLKLTILESKSSITMHHGCFPGSKNFSLQKSFSQFRPKNSDSFSIPPLKSWHPQTKPPLPILYNTIGRYRTLKVEVEQIYLSCWKSTLTVKQERQSQQTKHNQGQWDKSIGSWSDGSWWKSTLKLNS